MVAILARGRLENNGKQGSDLFPNLIYGLRDVALHGLAKITWSNTW